MKYLLIIIPVATMILLLVMYLRREKVYTSDDQAQCLEDKMAEAALQQFEARTKTPLSKASGNLALLLLLPLSIGLVVCYFRVEVISGVRMLPGSFFTFIVLFLSLIEWILVSSWSGRPGKNLRDTLLQVLAALAFLTLLALMDPLGASNSVAF